MSIRYCMFAVCAFVGAVVSSADTVRFMSYNVCHCEGMDGKIDIARTAARIVAEKPDFVGLQEIDWRTSRAGGVDQPAELGRLTGMHPVFAKAIFVLGGQYGVMTLSREKPLRTAMIPLPGAEPRVLLLAEFRDLVFGTTHLDLARTNRLASVEIIRRESAAFAGGKPVFLCGDWNAQDDSDVLAGMRGFMEVKSDVAGQTFHGHRMNGPDGQPLDMSRFCIDYIAVDRQHAAAFPVKDAHVVEDRVTSDHAPIVAELEIPGVRAAAPAVVPRPAEMTCRPGVLRLPAGALDESLYASKTVDPSIPAEGYRITVDAKGVAVAAADSAGFDYAAVTLSQLAFSAYGRVALPYCEIADAPRFGWRGLHLDDSRHFFGKAAVKRTLDLMRLHKLNVLHWHLTDDEGWRFPVEKWPKLTTVGAVREYSKNHKDLADRFEDGVYGPYSYSREDIDEIVAWAAARHVRIVPEVDVPGHCAALLKAYPQFGCFAADDAAAPKGAVRNVVCAGNDEAVAMLKDVFSELADRFPGELVHIGGDEVNKVNYRACTKCQARMRKLGLKTENDLQAWLMNEIAAHLARHGRRVVGWDEIILDGAAPKGTVVMSWRGAEGGIAAAKQGFSSVMTPHRFCYFDYSQCLADDPAVYPWFTERLPLEKAYSYDPLEGIPGEGRKYILGGQCCNWAEYTCNETELQWKTWPRACATAEIFWSPAATRDFADFRRRTAVHRRRLVDMHVNCAPLE